MNLFAAAGIIAVFGYFYSHLNINKHLKLFGLVIFSVFELALFLSLGSVDIATNALIVSSNLSLLGERIMFFVVVLGAIAISYKAVEKLKAGNSSIFTN